MATFAHSALKQAHSPTLDWRTRQISQMRNPEEMVSRGKHIEIRKK